MVKSTDRLKLAEQKPPTPGAARLLDGAPEFRAALAGWHQAHQRPLPWRTQPSLYRTVVSELMLQQTRVETVLPYFERWTTALPDFATLAAAPEEQILKLWEGLGYYRRARNLHRLAREIAALPEIPRDAAAWQKFPGIGPYTSAAITSIAFGTPAACVDGNVVRVLARLSAYDAPLKDSSTAARLFQPLADHLLDPADPGHHNQAMMELGATVCQRKANCAACPVANFCQARRLGKQDTIPAFPPREIEKLHVLRVWHEKDGRLLLSRAQSTARRLSDLCELPTAEEFGISPAELPRRATLQLHRKRSITRYSITEQIYRLDESPSSTASKTLFWSPLTELENLPFSGPHRRWINEILSPKLL